MISPISTIMHLKMCMLFDFFTFRSLLLYLLVFLLNSIKHPKSLTFFCKIHRLILDKRGEYSSPIKKRLLSLKKLLLLLRKNAFFGNKKLQIAWNQKSNQLLDRELNSTSSLMIQMLWSNETIDCLHILECRANASPAYQRETQTNAIICV